MNYKLIKVLNMSVSALILTLILSSSFAQYKDYKLSVNGDTLNAIDKKGLKQGKWVLQVAELRGNPGYEEEGEFKNDKRDGVWKRFSTNGDLLGIENYRFGGKDGTQQYYTMMGDLIRIENWRAYNPDAPYDTIPIYGTGNNEIVDYKIVKAEQYSVKHGEWKYYEPATGKLLKTERFDRGFPEKEPDNSTATTVGTPKKKVVPKEVQEFEKKNSGKKKVLLRQGQTGY